MWWHTVTHGKGSEGETGEWSGKPVLFTLPRNMVYPALLTLMCTPRLPVVDGADAPADLNGPVRFAERRNLVSARVPSHFKRSLHRCPVAVQQLMPSALRSAVPCWRTNRGTEHRRADGVIRRTQRRCVWVPRTDGHLYLSFLSTKSYIDKWLCNCRMNSVAQLVEALRCKLEGRGFDSRRYHWKFSLT
jgi:hypothetical protein